MSRWLVAVNRLAGKAAATPEQVRSALDAAGVDYDLVVPDGIAEMRAEVMAQAEAGRTHFAGVGGDGTVNFLVNTLLGLDATLKPVIGMLPAGTGCDLLRTFGMPQNLADAAKHLVGDSVYVIDVPYIDGDWGRRHYVNVAQTGVGAAAAQTAARLSRRMGALRYQAAFAGRLPRFPPARVTLVTEKRTVESTALAVILANAQFFAGGWNVAPKATLIDGVVDIQIINVKKRAAPALVPKVVKGTHLTDKGVRRLSAAEFDLTVDRAWPVEADGDYLGNTNLRGRVVPAAITLKI